MSNRRPSTYVAGPAVPEFPVPGFYKTRLKKGGPWLPARIVLESPTDEDGRLSDRPRLALYLNGKRHQQGYGAREIDRFWPLHPISKTEFDALNRAITDHGGEMDLRNLESLF